ncbi:acyl carrier protein [Alloprevotella sp. OH1205_COT-284]|uniref:acyl carrier protein n=1 Tax=Alloprevotella sp. OH1205_COT-284 TaxID=2491043 RepID=UPI000F6008D7|nr:acyl carrier protein [Alloprevotella sp. OH1205_COT-284]RRD80866.1 acyl carrier protein [Alloprevotella sp. OH1205_COT-284]
MSEIAEKVKAIIVEKLSVDAADVKDEASFTNDLGADSLETVELMMDLEKEFNITIPEEVSEKISTVGEAIEYIKANV